MLNGIYNKIKNAHAFKSLTAAPVMPTARLGVGDDEILFSIGNRFTTAPSQGKPKFEEIKTQADIQYIKTAENITPDMFPKLYWLGD